MIQQDPVDPARLLERIRYYGIKAGASDSSIQSMLDILQSPLGQAVLQRASGPDLTSLLVNDLYKVHMQSMYAQYMTGKPFCEAQCSSEAGMFVLQYQHQPGRCHVHSATQSGTLAWVPQQDHTSIQPVNMLQ